MTSSPFNRAELMTAEPEIYTLMRAIWEPGATEKVRPKQAPAAAAAPALSPAESEGDSGTIRSSLGGPCRIRAEARMSVTGQEGVVPIQQPTGSRILFETRPGGVYVLNFDRSL